MAWQAMRTVSDRAELRPAESAYVYQKLIARLRKFNAVRPWSHNDFYHAWILKNLPEEIGSALDVGCGTGNLVRVMSARCATVQGFDLDPGVIATARSIPTARGNATFTVADFTGLDYTELEDTGQFDVVTSLAVVHHVDLEKALIRLLAWLRPQGTLIILGCYRSSTVADRITDLIAVGANVIVGMWKSRQAADTRIGLSAPTAMPAMTLPEIREVAERVLPGARIRRRLFWRYSLVYRKS
jgi:2-polyprenyl-3-methyl-5-hydroxy-6-metoxy-1,4-benzoquinol methylase